MTLRVVGAGVGRTGTKSLKAALEQLLGAPCYHMVEVFQHPEHVALWHQAARGRAPDWDALFTGYVAAVDWPASAFWPELTRAYPDALVVLSLREPDAWWRSASQTIFPAIARAAGSPWRDMVDAMLAQRFVREIEDEARAKAAFERHNAAVRAGVPPERLLEWRAADGWAPLCHALGVPIPDAPFPRTNTSEEWRASGPPVSPLPPPETR